MRCKINYASAALADTFSPREVAMTDEPSLGLRQMNRLRILEALYRHPGSSRGDLARHTGLSRATVSTLVEELVRARVAEERSDDDDATAVAEAGPRASGRPPVLLS